MYVYKYVYGSNSQVYYCGVVPSVAPARNSRSIYSKGNSEAKDDDPRRH